jgi:hypothetical protein
MDPGAILLSLQCAALVGDVALRPPCSHQLTPLEDPHQIVDEVLGVAIAVDLVRLGILEAVTTSDE